MATEKRLKGIPYKCENCIHTTSCQRACSIFAYPFLDYMIRSASCRAYEPKVDAVEVVHGRWIWNEENECCVCSNCELSALNNYRGNSTESNHCPNCGAKMDGVGNA